MSATARPRRPLSRRRKLLFAAVCTVAAAAFAYGALLIVRSEQLYRYVTTNQRAVHGRLYAADERLGYAAIPGARGAFVFPVGPSVPIAIDAHGFRVPVDVEPAPAADGELLALGCSFTFGASCRAEHTFAERVARARGLVARNAGGNGYGLVQMLRLARRHVERLAPDVVLVQYAPWLVTRARSQMAPSYYGRMPVPYFAATADETLDVQGPQFLTIVPELPVSDYRARGGRLGFYLRCGIPLQLHDHWHLALAALSGWPAPERDRGKLIRLCYAEFARLCAGVGARAVAVLLGPEDTLATAELERIPGLELVHADRALRAELADDATEHAYSRRYHHWRGDPPVLVDAHPNAFAHERIAAAVLARLAQR